jgi:putative PIN family toxin of toxin-antitoxin system
MVGMLTVPVNVRSGSSGRKAKRSRCWAASNATVLEPLDKERGRICRKAADYMLPLVGLTRSPVDPQQPEQPLLNTRGIAQLPPRVVIDTNAVLDWLVFRDPDALRLGEAVMQGQRIWLVSPRMIGELSAVLAKPLAPRWEDARKHALTIDLENVFMRCAEPPPAWGCVCRDAGDQMFIDLAAQRRPAWLVTSDRDLLTLRRRAAALDVAIGTPAQWRQHAQASLSAPLK